MSKNEFNKIIILNHIFKDGKKQISEKILKTTFKSIQKFQKKSHIEIVKLRMLNSIPTFRIIKLKKKKSRVEIPKFISSKNHQISWGIKNLIRTSSCETDNGFNKKFKKTILLSTILKYKDELQKNALKKKNFFKHYRW